MARPEVAVLVSSFERPAHLRRCSVSIAAQRGLRGSLEVVVTDDGSRDETPQVVRQFAAAVPFPVRMTTHPHDGFQLARCRNEGVQASTADYFVFLDGDCIIPPDHLLVHLQPPPREYGPGRHFFPSERGDEQTNHRGRNPPRQFRAVGHVERAVETAGELHAKGEFYRWIGDRTRPKVFGNNIGIARARLRAGQRLRRELSRLGLRGRRPAAAAAGRRHRHRLDRPVDARYHLWHRQDALRPQDLEGRRERRLLAGGQYA